jgi:hypothetical protein
MTRVWKLLVFPFMALAAGCTVVGVSASDDTALRNSCTRDDSCGEGFSCRTGVCQTLNGTLESLLITASPTTDSFLPHFTFVTEVENVPTSGGTKDLEIPAPAQVVGSLNLPNTISCYPAFRTDEGDTFLSSIDGTVPVAVTLGLRQRLLGLSQQIYYARAMTPDRMGYRFNVRVPAGVYDVYLATPTRQGETDCFAPPQLYRNFPIGVKKNEQAATAITFRIPVISRLKLVIVWPQPNVTLDGWIADIIEPSGGNSISTQVILSSTAAGEDKRPIEYRVPLAYSTVLVGDPPKPDSSGELLRLRPAAGQIAPTIYLDRAALSLLSPDPNDDVRLATFTRLPKNVSLHGQLLKQAGGSSVSGSVTLVSTEIYGMDPGIFASYQTRVDAGAGGLINVDLPPGKYRVRAEPPLWTGPADGEPLSAAETIWDIPADLPIQFGKVIELPAPSVVAGRSQVPGAQVRAMPSLLSWSAFQGAFGDVPLTPRPASGLVNDQGQFALRLDPGRFNVTVEAPESLGLGWYVWPGADVGTRDLDLSAELKRPSVLTGRATIAVPGGTQALAWAAINAYAYLNKDRQYTRDPEQAVSVIQVAAARAKEDGSFRLLLPEALIAVGPN